MGENQVKELKGEVETQIRRKENLIDYADSLKERIFQLERKYIYHTPDNKPLTNQTLLNKARFLENEIRKLNIECMQWYKNRFKIYT